MTKRTRGETRISGRIADEIKKRIATGALRTGDRLPPERTMGARHHVSRVSVREAYRVLQDSGFVAVRRGSAGGAFIAAPGPSWMGESLALSLRLCDGCERQVAEASVIEPLVAALAARNATEVQIAQLDRQLSRRRLANPACRIGSHIARFRLDVADCANNVALAAVVRAVAEMSCPLSIPLDRVDGLVERVRGRHRLIHAAIAARDEAAAAAHMRDYLAWIQSQLLPSGVIARKSGAWGGSQEPPRRGAYDRRHTPRGRGLIASISKEA